MVFSHQHKPERTCVICHKRFLKSDLRAITRLKDGSIVFISQQQAQKPAGRSIYICSGLSCIKAVGNLKAKKGLEHWLKTKISDETLTQIANELQK